MGLCLLGGSLNDYWAQTHVKPRTVIGRGFFGDYPFIASK